MAAREVSVIVRAQDAVTGPLREMKSGFESFAGVLKGIGATLISGAIGTFLKGAVEDGIKAKDSMARFDVALQGVGLSYAKVAPEAEKYLSNLQRTTKFTDEDGRDALTNMVTITGDYQKSLGLMSLAVEVAAFRHVSLAEASTVVGKASIGVTKGLGDLGVTAKDGATAIEQMRASMGPFAEREGATFGGQLTIINNLWSEFKEKIGLAIIGSSQLSGELTGISKALVDAADYVDKNSESIGRFVGFLAQAAEGVAKVGKFVVEHTPNLYTGAKAFGVIGDGAKQMGEGTEEANQVVAKATTQMAGAFGASQTKMTTVLAVEGTRRIVKTKEQIAEEEAARKKAESEREAAAKKHAADLLRLQEEAQKSARELLSAHESARQEIVDAANKVMVGMTASQQTDAKAALKTHLDNLLLKWANFGSALDTEWTQVGTQYKQFGEITTGVTTDFDAVLAKHGQHLDDDRVKTELDRIAHEEWLATIVETADETSAMSQRFLDMARAAGVATPEIRELFNGISDISDAIANLASGDIIGGITMGLSGISNLAKMFTGESASARSVRIALDKNRDALEESSRAIGDLVTLNTPGAKLDKIQTALGKFFTEGQSAGLGSDIRVVNQVPSQRLNAILAAMGLTQSDLDALAKDQGMTIRTSSGRLDEKLLAQLLEQIKNLEPTKFGADFRGQREQLRAGAELNNLSPAEQAAQLAALAGGSLGSGAIGKALSGLDFSTAGGRGQGLAAIQSLFSALPGMSASDLGGLTGKDFLEVLKDLKSLLESAGIEATPSGPAVTPGLPPLTAVLSGIGAPISASSLPLIDLGGKSLELLTSMDSALSAGVAGDLTIDASMTIQNPVFQFGGDLAADRGQLQEAVQSALATAQGEQLRKIEEALGSNYLYRKRSLGDATRTSG